MEKVCKNNNELVPSLLTEKVFEIVRKADGILMKYFKHTISVDYKKDEFDPVTAADKESDSFIRSQLLEAFPEDLILSEENENIPSDYSGRVWMVDPLNGTKSFIKGSDTFAVVIGLLENGVPTFGCVSLPAQNIMYFAEKGEGAFQKVNGEFKRIATSSVKDIEDARIITREPSGEIRPIELKLNQIPFLKQIEEGSGAKLCTIASGDAEAHINTNFRAGKWDIAAPQIILEEAGGVVTDLDGIPIDYKNGPTKLERSFVASANSELHGKIINELKRLEV